MKALKPKRTAEEIAAETSRQERLSRPLSIEEKILIKASN